MTPWVVRPPSISERPPAKIIAATNCLRMRTRRIRSDDNYSREISHFICKIASADRPPVADINFPPLKLFRRAAKITGPAGGQSPE